MRLEEWQKWLDSQFVEAEEVAPSDRSASSPPAPPGSLQPTLEFAAVQDNLVPIVVPPQAPPVPSVQETAMPSAPLSSSSGARPAAHDLADELDVPAIERYLPYLRQRQEEPAPENGPKAVDASSEPVADVPVREPETAEEKAASDVIETPVPPEEAIGERAEEPVVASTAPPASIPQDVVPTHETKGEVPAPTMPSAEEESRQIDTPSQAPLAHRLSADENRRQGISYRRTRHARNVRPAELVQEMDAAALWKLVPRHLNTLVDMGSDLQLISRLLDPSLSLEDTARLLNVRPATVRKCSRKGLLSHQRSAGNPRRFKLSDVFAFLEAQSKDRN